MGGQPGERSHALQKADEPQEGTGWQGLSYQTLVKKRVSSWSLHVVLVTLRETVLKAEDGKW